MRITRQSDAPFSRQRMFDIVTDIDAYKDFLPWCSDSHIHSSDGETATATLVIAYRSFSMPMTTRNTMRPHDTVTMDLCEPSRYLKSLHGEWRFKETGATACHIALSMDIQFSAALLELTLRPIFDYIGGTLVRSFIGRARDVARHT